MITRYTWTVTNCSRIYPFCQYHLAKLPRFLDYEVNPFISDEFEVQVEEGLTEAQEQESIREQIENTIRWRRAKEDGVEVSLLISILAIAYLFIIAVIIDFAIQCALGRMGRWPSIAHVR
jgi:hypothetical protein